MVQIDAGHFSRDASIELSEALAKPASYKLMYFQMLSNGATGRDLLAFGGVEWSSVAPAVRFRFVSSDDKGSDNIFTRFPFSSASFVNEYRCSICYFVGLECRERTDPIPPHASPLCHRRERQGNLPSSLLHSRFAMSVPNARSHSQIAYSFNKSNNCFLLDRNSRRDGCHRALSRQEVRSSGLERIRRECHQDAPLFQRSCPKCVCWCCYLERPRGQGWWVRFLYHRHTPHLDRSP